ncbi:hypothetical protein BG53_06930 [Paenibacillus darwinianus]|uniref:Uncharacterized protein n=1 Tax=Paenibacillus darwinianus TaxID=1380763 RepID=A0A9W5RZP1_9BACL|nr:hypothetical protein [Paenibacillus darwinianus]EXX86038.1 hypothetical protein CH50_08075 [Paenibacillus darwinianus]EXX86168.1 hypothetical protein BG53_06930 [Paenibacillus darwinianus]EXX86489.1 hypothetical protein BG52_06450 [Paenibacillus darwinianus]
MMKAITAVVLILMFLQGSSGQSGAAISLEKAPPVGQTDTIVNADMKYDGTSGDGGESFARINGIDMEWTDKEVLTLLGPPETVWLDEYTPGRKAFRYKGVAVGFYDGLIESVSVDASEPAIAFGDTVVPMDLEALTGALGEPDFIAEDGRVYKGRGIAVKLFMDETGRRLESVVAFWSHSE